MAKAHAATRQIPFDLGIDTSDFRPGDLIDLVAAAKLLPGRRPGKPATLDTVRRWANPERGYSPSGPSGPRVVLPTVWLQGLRQTTEAWVAVFLRTIVRLGDPSWNRKPKANPRTPRQEAAAHRRAAARLKAEGFKVN